MDSRIKNKRMKRFLGSGANVAAGWAFGRRRYHRHRAMFWIIAVIAILLFWFGNELYLHLVFLKIKIRYALIDHGYTTCNMLRKPPLLYVQDDLHVQVVWELNCKAKNHVAVAWKPVGNDKLEFIQTVEPTLSDESHTLYRATIGPIDETAYTYRIIMAEHPNEEKIAHYGKDLAQHTFSWYGSRAEPFRIVAIGDNQFRMSVFLKLMQRVSRVTPRPSYMIHVGDAVERYESRDWETDFFLPLSYFGVGPITPIIYAHGNHDYDHSWAYHYAFRDPSSDLWQAFTLAHGAIKVIVLDSNVDLASQDQWLEAELSSRSAREAQFRIVVVHIPPFVEYWEPDAWFGKNEKTWGAFVKDRYVDFFEKYNVDLVISGHQHNYQRGQRNGIQYAIIGGAGGTLDHERVENWNMYEVTAICYHYVLLDVVPPKQVGDPWQLVWEAKDLQDRRLDHFTLAGKPQYEDSAV